MRNESSIRVCLWKPKLEALDNLTGQIFNAFSLHPSGTKLTFQLQVGPRNKTLWTPARRFQPSLQIFWGFAFDTFNDPTSPPPKQGDTVTVAFDRESLMVLGE